MNDARTELLLLLLLGLLIIIAFSSGTEVAMLSVNRYRLRHRANSGQRAARLLEKLMQRPDDWLGVNLVILAAASVFASQAATILAQRSGWHQAVPVAGAILTIVMIVFGELAPKIFGATYAERVALEFRLHLQRAGGGGPSGAVGDQPLRLWLPAPVRRGARPHATPSR